MTEAELYTLFEVKDVVRRGHFQRSSGRHTDFFVQCARLFEDAAQAEQVCRMLAEQCRPAEAQMVMSAAIGGVLPGYEVSRALKLPYIYCERKDGAMTLRRGFSIAKGQRVLIIEDEITTGASVREMMEIVRALGGETAGIGCLVDKTGGHVTLHAPFFKLITLDIHSWREGACPKCQEGEVLTRV